MKRLSELRGLRFPDIFVIRMFFKEGLQREPGRVLEFGCGNGNNLALFSEFGWDITGVDYNRNSLADARHNLEGIGHFIECDLSLEFPTLDTPQFDAVLLPNLVYYLPRRRFELLLRECRRRVRSDGILFLSARLPEDWRWGRGKQEEPGGFRLECHETDEYGLLNVFYGADELVQLIDEHFGPLQQQQRLRVSYENPAHGTIVRNAEMIIWGRART